MKWVEVEALKHPLLLLLVSHSAAKRRNDLIVDELNDEIFRRVLSETINWSPVEMLYANKMDNISFMLVARDH